MTDVLRKQAHGWASMQDDILLFARLLNLNSLNHTQQHYLLRVQNGTRRLGISGDMKETFPVFGCSLLWRAIVWEKPSVCFFESTLEMQSWIRIMTQWMAGADPSITSQINVMQSGRGYVVGRVRMALAVGPWDKDQGLIPGKQDILLIDWDNMPTERILRAIDLTSEDDCILYLPHHSHGSLVQYEHGRKTGDGTQGNRPS